MTREEVLRKAFEGRITWLQAAEICRITPRHLLRLREAYQMLGREGLRDGRAGRRQPLRIPPETIEKLCWLKREVYPDFSIQHFYEFATEKHGLKLSYTLTRNVLQIRGLVEKAPGRGKYRRRRERRPLRGMLVHLDASTHEWIAGLAPQDLMVALDDADGRILFARFFPQEGVHSTLCALRAVLYRYGRFCELYTDRGSHFCHTTRAGEGPDEVQLGQVPRVLKALGIRQILARSPEARGRSERCFGTLQGRLPQELRLHGIDTYEAANTYLEQVFVPDFNRRFTVVPQQPESAFTSTKGLNLELVLSVQHERQVGKDNTVQFQHLALQLSPTTTRAHFVRCPVIVHEFLDGTLGVSYQGRLVGRFDRAGRPLA
ncbi:MAG: ISNCY family transposase, partial [Planctomycetota bacterium]